VLELRSPGDRRTRPLAVAIALLVAAQLVVVATQPPDADEPAERPALEDMRGDSDEALEVGDPGPTSTALRAPITSLPPFVPPPAGTTPSTQRPGSPPDTSAPAPSTGGCGPPITKADGSAWVCTLADDFDGSSLDARTWSVERTKTSAFSPSGRDCFVDDPDNVSVSGGMLHLVTRDEGQVFTCESTSAERNYPSAHTSGMVATSGKFSQAFGRFEVRAKLPPARVQGVATMFWLRPDDPFRYGAPPASGEIDFAAWSSRQPTVISPFVRYNPSSAQSQTIDCVVADVEAFHTYVVEWAPSAITVFIDGRKCLENRWNALLLTPPAPFDQPFNLALTQGLGAGGNEVQPGVTPLPAETTIDHVRVWR
jgi:beta-glucanase (GH16 family)